MQVHEQQSERQRKNVLQKVLTFTLRAREMQFKDLGFKTTQSMF
jgi:hypothetical protein